MVERVRGFQFRAGGDIHLIYVPYPGAGVSDIYIPCAQFRDDPAAGYPYADTTCLGRPGSADLGERTVTASVAAFGDLWAPYYPPHAELLWVNLSQLRVGISGQPQLFSLGTGVASTFRIMTVRRGSAPALASVGERALRVFEPRSHGTPDRRGVPRPMTHMLAFNGLPGPAVYRQSVVTPTQGGVDLRDRALIAYLSSRQTGLCGADCTRFLDQAYVREWIAY